MRVYLSNLGCKLNQAEMESLARQLTTAGHRLVDRLEEAELHIVNTCTVTHRAARDSRKLGRRGRRLDERIRTVLTGCWATEKPAAAADLAGVDLVVTNDRKSHLLALMEERFGGADAAAATEPASDTPVVPTFTPEVSFGNTRALVKVEDGCNMRCAFCIIPSTRGRQRSRPVAEVVAEVDGLARAGAREVVITGVQISHYRWRRQGLVDLLHTCLEETPVPRLRITSIAPWAFDDRLLELLAGPRLCRHVHMSLQSGSTATLERMRRPYTAAAYAALVERLRRAVPGVAVTTDVIVGFPGETDAEFEDSLAFVDELAFARTHIFPYSVREGTEAASLPGHVEHAVQRQRMGRMLEVAARRQEDFQRSQVGERLEVLWEERRDGVWWGTSDNYVRVRLDDPEGVERLPDLANRLTEVQVAGVTDGGVVGRVASPPEPVVGPTHPMAASPSLLPVVS